MNLFIRMIRIVSTSIVTKRILNKKMYSFARVIYGFIIYATTPPK